jgi:hypothetical protein
MTNREQRIQFSTLISRLIREVNVMGLFNVYGHKKIEYELVFDTVSGMEAVLHLYINGVLHRADKDHQPVARLWKNYNPRCEQEGNRYWMKKP